MRAAIYARVGNPDQLAVQNQTEVLTGQIRGMWGDSTEIDIYADNGISGLQTDRPDPACKNCCRRPELIRGCLSVI